MAHLIDPSDQMPEREIIMPPEPEMDLKAGWDTERISFVEFERRFRGFTPPEVEESELTPDAFPPEWFHQSMEDAGRKIADAIDRTALGWHEDILGLHKESK